VMATADSVSLRPSPQPHCRRPRPTRRRPCARRRTAGRRLPHRPRRPAPAPTRFSSSRPVRRYARHGHGLRQRRHPARRRRRR
jgi:hypothetical protein